MNKSRIEPIISIIGKLTAALLLVSVFLPGLPLQAKDVAVTSSINAEKIGRDDVLIYTVTLKGISNPQRPDVSNIKDFKVAQTSIGTEFRSINGVYTHYVNFTFYLVPQKTGTLTVPPVTYQHEGKEYKTRAFTVQVVKGSVNPPQTQRRRRSIWDMDDDFFPDVFRKQRRRTEVDVRLVPRISKKNPVKGEQIIFKVLLYTRNRIQGINMVSNQSLPGFWQEWFPIGRSIEGNTEVVNGKEYRVYEIRKAALFPTKSGSLTIPALKFEVALVDDSFSMFPDTRRISRSTPELTLQVTEPPAEATGLPVGRFSFSVKPDKTEVDVNDIVTFKIKITGNGNVKKISPPEFKTNEFYKVYPSKISRNVSHGNGSVSGTVEAEVPVAFKKNGDISFPAMEFKYFNPASTSVVTLKSKPLMINVTGKKEQQGNAVTVPTTEIIKKGEDIDFIKKGRIHNQENLFYNGKLFLALLLLPFLINILFLSKRYLLDRFLFQNALLQKRKHLNMTLKQLGDVRDEGEISPILENYLKEKAGIGLSEINNQRIDQLLAKYGVNDVDIKTFIQLKTKSESSRFSPEKASTRSGKELKQELHQLAAILKRIDGKIK
jgi:hypothetical protein